MRSQRAAELGAMQACRVFAGRAELRPLASQAALKRAGPRRQVLRVAMALAVLFGTASAPARAGLRLPDSYCRADLLFADGFEAGAAYVPAASAGAAASPGDVQRSVFVASTGQTRSYYLRIPPLHSVERPPPVYVLLHGATGDQASTAAAAHDMRTLFAAAADSQGALLIALPAGGAQGGWLGGADSAFVAAALADAEATYVIDRKRRGLWGFSAGAHFAHGLALQSAEFFAAYALKAGALQAYAGINAPAAAARVIPLQSRIGSSDSLLPFAQDDVFRFLNAGWALDLDLQYQPVPGGHEINASDANAAAQWLCRWALPNLPQQRVR